MKTKDKILFKAFLQQEGFTNYEYSRYGNKYIDVQYKVKGGFLISDSIYKICTIDTSNKKVNANGRPVTNIKIKEMLCELTNKKYKLVFNNDNPIKINTYSHY